MTTSRQSSKPVLFAVLGFLLAFPCIALGAFLYLRYGHPPVATADQPFPSEEKIAHVALNARIDRELVQPPVPASGADLTAGARTYVTQCAVCHGTPGREGQFGRSMYPDAPQLWQKHHNGVVGVSDDPPNVSYWKVENGIRLSGMPSFQKTLTTAEMWNVSFLIAGADKPQSPAVTSILAAPKGEGPVNPAAVGAASSGAVPQ